MTKFKLNHDSAIAATLYILNKVGEPTDFHKLFKILYFAEQNHLAHFGKPITGDEYIAMNNGPVPSTIYDILKAIRDERDFPINYKEYNSIFNVYANHWVLPLKNANQDLLAETQIECLDRSIRENKDLNFTKLTDKSHDQAWGQASYEMSYEDIAASGGANSTMLEYLKTVAENQNAKIC